MIKSPVQTSEFATSCTLEKPLLRNDASMKANRLQEFRCSLQLNQLGGKHEVISLLYFVVHYKMRALCDGCGYSSSELHHSGPVIIMNKKSHIIESPYCIDAKSIPVNATRGLDKRSDSTRLAIVERVTS